VSPAEKKTLILQKENRPQGTLHLKTFQRASYVIICKLAEDQALNQKQAALLFKLFKDTQEIGPEILQNPSLLKNTGKDLPPRSKA